jgi:TRAP-type C4-dicarboxylate transport system permease small subunit
MPDETGDSKSADEGEGEEPEATEPTPDPPAATEAESVEKKPIPAPPIAKQAWAEPLMRFDQAWTRFEAKLCGWVLVTEIAALCLWISLKGLSAEYQVAGSGDKNVSGLVFRALLTSVLFGLVAHFITRPKAGLDAEGFADAQTRHRVAVTTSVFAGLLFGRIWANVGVEYFSNLLNWMQNASLLMLIGGLRGVVTRLTLWLALLGGSIATAKGKHINIDVVMRFLSPKMRIPVAVLGWVAAAVVCIAGASEKLGNIAHEMRTDLFLVGRQVSLDLSTLPRVIAGTKYSDYFTAGDWNAWVSSADWAAHFPPDAVRGLLTPEDRAADKHLPAVSIPGGDEARGLLIKDADFVFPFGLLMIAFRFLLRAVLVLAGHIRVDPDLAHEEDEVEESHPDSEAELHAASKKGA